LTDYIYGRVGTPEEAQQALTQTAITQPAILSCDVAMQRLLAEHGITPGIVAGHSLGEYAACVAASVMSAPDAMRAVAERGKAMTNATPDGTDPGWMAAIAAPLDEVEPVLEGVDGYVIPANKNCQSQTIIAGASSAVERAMGIFDDKGFQTIRLPVSHAFHTSIVEPACGPLSTFLKGLDIAPPKIPILANVTGAEYPSGPDAPSATVDLLSRQVASPVEFIAEVEKMYDLGARTFIEVGPRRTLTSFVGNILGKRPHQAIATNNPRKGDERSFIEALAGLKAAGFKVDTTPRIESETGIS
jgi:acyl transferase domain-containing protein